MRNSVSFLIYNASKIYNDTSAVSIATRSLTRSLDSNNLRNPNPKSYSSSSSAADIF